MQTLRLVEALTAGGYHCVTVCYFEYDFPIVQMYEKAGSRVVCLSAYGRRPAGNRNVYRFLQRGLKRVVDEYRPKIAHIQYMAPGAMPIFILRRLGIKTIIATLHTDASIYRSLSLIRFLQKHTVKAFTCVTQAAEISFFGESRLYANDTQLKKRNHFTIYNCLSPRAEITDTALPAKTIGVVARLEHIKGADYIMPAFAKVLKQHPDCTLAIVGDGKEREAMQQQQKELGIADGSIQWHGTVPHSKLPELYRTMSIVWVPSRTEGFGLSAIEAMSQGRPVVASATGGLNEIVHNQKDGLLFATGDIDDLAHKTAALLDNPALLQTMKTNALDNARQFAFDEYKALILSLYNKLTSEAK